MSLKQSINMRPLVDTDSEYSTQIQVDSTDSCAVCFLLRFLFYEIEWYVILGTLFERRTAGLLHFQVCGSSGLFRIFRFTKRIPKGEYKFEHGGNVPLFQIIRC